MAELQAMGTHYSTFDELAEGYMVKMLRCTQKANTVVDVFDRYDVEHSIKSEERRRRQTAADCVRKYQVHGANSIPPWQKFMAVSSNKASLTNFLCCYITKHASASLGPHIKIYLAGGLSDGTSVKCVSHDGVTDISDLYSTQKEADTRMLLHACYADKQMAGHEARGRRQIVIKTPDTDVLVLTAHYFSHLKHTDEVWLEMGRMTAMEDQCRHIPVHTICQHLNPQIPKILPALHALTGCDTTACQPWISCQEAWRLRDRKSVV